MMNAEQILSLIELHRPVLMPVAEADGGGWTARIGMVLHVMSGDAVPDGSGRTGFGHGPTVAEALAGALAKGGEGDPS